MGIRDHLRVNRIFVSKHIPRVAKTANRVNRLAQIIGEVPAGGFTGAKCIGMGFTELSSFYVKQARKSVTKAFKNVFSGVFRKVDDLKDMVSKEDQDYVDSLEDVDVTKEDIDKQEKDGMLELKKDIHLVQDQITEMNDMLIDLTHIPGCKVIQSQYIAFMDKVSMDDWSFHFKDYKAEFENTRIDFTTSNLTLFFKKILKSKCSKDYQPLKKAFIYIWDTRAMYFFLKCTYYQHIPEAVPAMDIEKALKHELELLDKDLQTLEDAIQTVCFGFFKSLLTSKSSGKNQWEALIDDLDWRQRTEYKCLPEISFWNKRMTNEFKNLVPIELQSLKCYATIIQNYNTLTKQENICDIKDQFPVLLVQIEDGIKDFNEEISCSSLLKDLKEKDQISWDSVFKEYSDIKRFRLMFLDLKLTYVAHINSSDTDLKKKGDEEIKILENDMKTVDNAILNIIEDSLKEFNEDFMYKSFMEIFKNECQNSWDPLFEEYHRIKSLRSDYLEVKLTLMTHIPSSTKDTEKKRYKENKDFENDMKTVDNAILKIIEDSLKEFNEDFMYKSFMEIFKNECQNSWDPLFEEYHRIKSLRSDYLEVKLTLMTHIPSSTKDTEKKRYKENKDFENDMKTVDNAVQKVCSGFFFAALTAHADWPLGLEFVPDFDSFKKDESSFYKKSTVGEIMYGDKSRNTTKVKMYRIKDTNFVYCHDSDNHEYIHKLNDEGQLQEGIYRYKPPWGDTVIGCRLFRRGDRQEDKTFRLCKFSSSGEIRYQEKVSNGKPWRTVTEYKFHPETLSWSKSK